jgi:SAM-dependent methyltransferase
VAADLYIAEAGMTLRPQLFRVYGALRDRIAPGLLYSQRLYERRLAEILPPDADWLDLGCGHQVLPAWRGTAEAQLVARCRSVTGIDYDMPSLRTHRSVRRRVRGDISALPFADASFDLVTANMVVEHLDDPERQFREIARVLKPAGTFLLHTPNAYGYQTALSRVVPERLKGLLIRVLDSRSAADVFPTHYRANTDAAIADVGRRAGLSVARIQMVATDAVFAVVPPLAALELAAIRLTLSDRLRRYRSDIIATLEKPADAASGVRPADRVASICG